MNTENIAKFKSEIENAPIYFIRHNCFDDNRFLVENQMIAINYNKEKTPVMFEEIIDKHPTQNAVKTCYRYMNELMQNGGIVLAKYKSEKLADYRKLIIGYVKKGSVINHVNDPNYKEKYPYELLKALPYEKLGEIRFCEYPVLSVFGGQATMAKYESENEIVTKIIKSYLLGNQYEASVTLLHDKVLEQLCLEWLRRKGHLTSGIGSNLNYCKLATGSSLADIDIAGVLDNGKDINVQVTHSSQRYINNKYSGLTSYSTSGAKECVQVMFCADVNDPQKEPTVITIDINKVFNDFAYSSDEKSQIMGRKMLSDMIGLPTDRISW